MASKNASRIKNAVESKLVRLLSKKADAPTKEDLQTLSIAVKFLAVSAKMEDAEWGSDLDGLNDEGGENDSETDI